MDVRNNPGLTARNSIHALSTTLADGQIWGLARPAIRFRPRVVRRTDKLGCSIETIELIREYDYPSNIQQLIGRLRDQCETGTSSGQIDAILDLGVALLLRAHDIEPAFAASLFAVDPTTIPRIVDDILETVTSNPGPRGGNHRKPGHERGKERG